MKFDLEIIPEKIPPRPKRVMKPRKAKPKPRKQPDNSRVVKWKDYTCIEYAPQTRLVNFRWRGTRKKISLKFPYMQFWVCNNQLYLSCTDKPIDANQEQKAYQPPLPHINSGQVCMAATDDVMKSDLDNLKLKIKSFWNSPFTVPYYHADAREENTIEAWLKSGVFTPPYTINLQYYLGMLGKRETKNAR
jgi:hypothetical protein